MISLARSLPGPAADQLLLYGQPRGGIMAYRARADGMKARAAVVSGGVSDLSLHDRPDAADMDALESEALSDYATEAANHFCRRSASCWPENWRPRRCYCCTVMRTRVRQAVALASRLKVLRAPVTSHIVEHGTHVWLDHD